MRLSTIFTLAALCLSQSLLAQQQELRPRSIVDTTRTARLNGSLPQPASPTDVSTLIANQSGLGRSWTSYFIGQVRCSNGNGTQSSLPTCAYINANGTVSFYTPAAYAYIGNASLHDGFSPTPVGYSNARGGDSTNCTLFTAAASSTDRARAFGEAPYDFVVYAQGQGGC